MAVAMPRFVNSPEKLTRTKITPTTPNSSGVSRRESMAITTNWENYWITEPEKCHNIPLIPDLAADSLRFFKFMAFDGNI